MPRPRHPNAAIEAALRHAEAHGWRVEVGGSHCWGRMYCPWNDKNCRTGRHCMASVWSTPSSREKHARYLRSVVNGCAHVGSSERRHGR